jgi:hypothetical protein
VPFLSGHACAPRNAALHFLTDLGTRAASDSIGFLSRQQFVMGLLQELTVALCDWNTRIERTIANYFSHVVGRVLMPRMARPTAVGAENSQVFVMVAALCVLCAACVLVNTACSGLLPYARVFYV